jgi:hypothetical protein
MARDMTLFVDDDGVAYHIYASEENCTLHISQLDENYTGCSGNYARFFVNRFMEAPAMFKKDGNYYLFREQPIALSIWATAGRRRTPSTDGTSGYLFAWKGNSRLLNGYRNGRAKRRNSMQEMFPSDFIRRIIALFAKIKYLCAINLLKRYTLW